MSTELLHAPLHPSLMGPASRYVKESREAMLAYESEELAALRFSIILTAKWEASDDEDPQQRAELRADLKRLQRKSSGGSTARSMGSAAGTHASGSGVGIIAQLNVSFRRLGLGAISGTLW